MLTNAAEPGCRSKLEAELASNPAFSRVIAALESSGAPFAVDTAAGGIEIVPLDEVKQAPNRCRMKLFKPRESSERLCAFFYKRSNLSFSRDRFSYGGVEFVPDRLFDSDIRSWIDWLVSGLDPDLKPEHLRRAFLYTVPE